MRERNDQGPFAYWEPHIHLLDGFLKSNQAARYQATPLVSRAVSGHQEAGVGSLLALAVGARGSCSSLGGFPLVFTHHPPARRESSRDQDEPGAVTWQGQ